MNAAATSSFEVVDVLEHLRHERDELRIAATTHGRLREEGQHQGAERMLALMQRRPGRGAPERAGIAAAYLPIYSSSMSTLLGHLAFRRFTDQTEDLATEALAYILARSAVARRAAAEHLARAGIEVPGDLTYASQVVGESQERPDLVGTHQGREVLLLEAKFWAGLTEHQPVGYLRRLSSGGTLLFLVPEARLASIWSELLERCLAAGAPVEIRATTGAMRHGMDSQGRHLALTSWRSLLEDMRHHLADARESELAEDVNQLRGLCDRMDQDVFLPVTDVDLTSKHYRRIFDFAGLTDDLLLELERRGVAERRGLKQGSGFGFSGRYFYLFGAAVFLACDLRLWMKHGMSPISLTVYGDTASWKANKRAAFAALEPLRQRVPSRLFEDSNGFPTTPLLVPLGVERDRVLAAITDQLLALQPLLASLAVAPGPSQPDEQDTAQGALPEA